MKNQSKNSDSTWMGAGLLAAFAASLCCVTPVLAFLAGIGGIASTFSWIEPLRPYLIGITILLLGFAWYKKLKLVWKPSCACEENPSFWQTKSFLGMVSVLAVVMLTFPYYSDAFFPNPKPGQQITYVDESNLQSTTLDVEGMTCTGCEATVKNAAHNVEGVLEASASYKSGNATITFDGSKTDRKQIVAAINKTGFTVKQN